MQPIAVSLIDLSPVQTLLGDNWRLILVIGVPALVVIPALFFKSPFGTMAQFAGGAIAIGAVAATALSPSSDLNNGILGFALGIAMIALGAVPRHLAKMRDEHHLQNLRVLKLLAAQVPKKPQKTIRQQVQGD